MFVSWSEVLEARDDLETVVTGKERREHRVGFWKKNFVYGNDENPRVSSKSSIFEDECLPEDTAGNHRIRFSDYLQTPTHSHHSFNPSISILNMRILFFSCYCDISSLDH